MNEHLYNRLRHDGLKCLELPTKHVNLLSAFNKKSNRVRKQAMIDVNIGDFKINQIILLPPQLLTDAILGLDFLVDYNAVINCAEQIITLKINGECTKIKFIGIKKTTDELDCVEESFKDLFRNFGLVSDFPRKLLSLTADRGQHPTDPSVTAKGDALVEDEKGGTIVSKMNKEQLIENQVNALIPRRVSDRDEYVEFVSRYDDACRNFQSTDLNNLAKDKEGHIVDDCSATEHEIYEECRKNTTDAANRRTLCFTTTCSKTNAVDTHHKQQGLDTRQITTDDRMITAEQLRGKVSENNLSPQQQEDLYNVLTRYQQHLTK